MNKIKLYGLSLLPLAALLPLLPAVVPSVSACAIVDTTTQVGVGSTPQQQINQSDYFVGDGDINDTGVTSPVIEVTPQAQIDMQIPAYDQQFVDGLVPQQ